MTPSATLGESHHSVIWLSRSCADGWHCDGVGSPHSTGMVEQKPGQLVSFSNFAAYGFPIHVALPKDCSLPVGQVVEFRAKL